jgi:hypothetical protein
MTTPENVILRPMCPGPGLTKQTVTRLRDEAGGIIVVPSPADPELGTMQRRSSMDKRFEVTLPDELLVELGWPEAEVSDRVKEALVMELVRLGRLSESQAADILALNRWKLLEVMARHEIPAVRMNPDELKQELKKEIRRGA